SLVCYLEYSSVAHGFNLAKSLILGVLMAMIGYLECYLEYSSVALGFNLAKSLILGVLMAMIGLCIQHHENGHDR
ncbi:hypothetical protein T484DRAFT_1868434, partial [Baffinella frigidus]